MLNIKHLSRQLELSFWELTIPMLSESKLLRRLLPAVYDLGRKDLMAPLVRKGLIWSFSGFIVGIILGLATV